MCPSGCWTETDRKSEGEREGTSGEDEAKQDQQRNSVRMLMPKGSNDGPTLPGWLKSLLLGWSLPTLLLPVAGLIASSS